MGKHWSIYTYNETNGTIGTILFSYFKHFYKIYKVFYFHFPIFIFQNVWNQKIKLSQSSQEYIQIYWGIIFFNQASCGTYMRLQRIQDDSQSVLGNRRKLLDACACGTSPTTDNHQSVARNRRNLLDACACGTSPRLLLPF